MGLSELREPMTFCVPSTPESLGFQFIGYKDLKRQQELLFIECYCGLASGLMSDYAGLFPIFLACLYGSPEVTANSLGVAGRGGGGITSQACLGEVAHWLRATRREGCKCVPLTANTLSGWGPAEHC